MRVSCYGCYNGTTLLPLPFVVESSSTVLEAELFVAELLAAELTPELCFLDDENFDDPTPDDLLETTDTREAALPLTFVRKDFSEDIA